MYIYLSLEGRTSLTGWLLLLAAIGSPARPVGGQGQAWGAQ